MKSKWFKNTGVVSVWREEYCPSKPKRGRTPKGREKCLHCTVPANQCTGLCKFKEDENEPRTTI